MIAKKRLSPKLRYTYQSLQKHASCSYIAQSAANGKTKVAKKDESSEEESEMSSDSDSESEKKTPKTNGKATKVNTVTVLYHVLD